MIVKRFDIRRWVLLLIFLAYKNFAIDWHIKMSNKRSELEQSYGKESILSYNTNNILVMQNILYGERLNAKK